MSDNVCKYCNGYETTAGFMHEARCPMNHTTTTYYNVPLEKEQAEIARLKSALEKAEAEISELKSCMWYVRYHNLIDKFENIEQERDEARRWARQFYAQLQQLWKDFIDG